jgi:hypothetical protein
MQCVQCMEGAAQAAEVQVSRALEISIRLAQGCAGLFRAGIRVSAAKSGVAMSTVILTSS